MTLTIVLTGSDLAALLSSLMVAGVLAAIARQETKLEAITARVVTLEARPAAPASAPETKP